MYQITIVSGSVKEINNVCKALKEDLWTGAKTYSLGLAELIKEQALKIEPAIEIDITWKN